MKKKNLFSTGTSLLTIAIMITVIFIAGCNKKDMNDTGMKTNDNMEKKTDNSMGMNNSQMMSKSMDNMMGNMHKMKMTGNMDVDYVTMMIMHHQAAIEMSKTETSSGKDSKVKGLAENITKDQEKEIAAMQSWLDKNKDKKGTMDNSSKLMSSMMGMMGEHKMAGDTDKDFLSMMIVHHQGAIDMANVEIKYGTDAEIKKMAEDVVKKQTAEISQMKEWQK